MPSIRINLSTLDELDDMEPEELDELALGDQRYHGADLKTNPDARALSADRQARRREDRRKHVWRGGRRS
ncbi:MAG: hypothetical protein H7Y32_07505 [Chloroflexales bacterium]|nr:hypothetical protein [Chloroflexales bacterium]